MTSDITDPTMDQEEIPSGATPLEMGIGAADGGGTGTPTGGDVPKSRWLREVVVVVVIALSVAVLLRLFVVQTFYIPSGSMEPTLQIGDRILVDKLSYHLHSVHQGDIVVFARPPGENCGGQPVADLVKRVIGLPGQTVSLSHGYVDINGKRLDESYLPPSEQGVTQPGPPVVPNKPYKEYNLARPFVVPADHYFVMGDNRTESCDSRYWGPIDRSLIVGKVDVRVWPVTSFHWF